MKRLPTTLFAAALAGALVFLHARRNEVLDSFSLARSVAFSKASRAVLAPAREGAPESYLVVFDANKRVARVDGSGALLRLLKSKGSPEAGFYLANDVAVGGDGGLYIASTYINPDTLAVNRECVVRYDADGAYGGVVFSRAHDEAALVDNMGLIRSLQATPDGVQFCMLADEAVLGLRVEADGTVRTNRAAFANASAVVQSAALSPDGQRLAFTTAAAEIWAAEAGGEPRVVFDGKAVSGDTLSIPCDIRIVGGEWVFSDLGRDGIARVRPGGDSRMVFDADLARAAGYVDRFYECKAFQVAGPDRLVFSNNEKIVDFDGKAGTARVLGEARWGAGIWAARALYWAVLLLALLCLAILLRRLAAGFDEADRRMFKQTLMALLMVAVAAGIAVAMVFNNMSQRLNDLSRKALRGYLDLGALVVDGEAVARVNHVRDYGGEDYTNLLAQLRRIITRDGEVQSGAYTGIYKVFGNKVAALAYHDGLRGIFYPYDYDYAASIYAPVREKGEPYLGEMVDQYGVWQIGVAPIRDRAGECVGLLEVGFDMSAREEANRKLLATTVISIAMILFVLVFIFLEIGFLNSHVLGRRRDLDAAGAQRYDEGVLRFGSYLALSGVFLSVAFLPLFSKSLARPVGNLPLDLVVGFPLVVETLCGAVAALLYGHIRHRLGLKFDIVLACLVTAAGMVVTSRAETYEHLLLGRVVVGAGMGLLMIAFRTYFLLEPDAGRRESGVVALTAGVVAGINTGSVAGGMLADKLGMRSVFQLQAALLALAALFVLAMLRNRRRDRESGGVKALSVREFLGHREIGTFFCLVFLPVTACGLFLGFFFPLFGASRGCSEAEISLAFMLFGLCGVYLGPLLTKLTTEAFGAGRALVVGALLMAAGLAFFAFAQTLTAAYVTVLLFGLTDSFIFNQGMSYLSSRPAVARFGEDKAMGVYHVFESGGEALGPIVFGLAMSFSLAAGVGLIAGALALSASLFMALNKPTREPPC